MIIVNVSKKSLDYLDDEKIIKSISLVGSKVSADLVAKDRFHLWFKGDPAPSEHTCHNEGYRDLIIKALQLRDRPPFSILTVHEGPVRRQGRVSLFIYFWSLLSFKLLLLIIECESLNLSICPFVLPVFLIPHI